jgi:quercetin dioxygenase-like cupin family protein
MSMHSHRWPLILSTAAAVLLGASIVRAQPPAAPTRHTGVEELMQRDLIGMPGKEIVVSAIEVPPGASSPPHRHDAQVFVYVLQGKMIMQVKGGPRMTLGPGQMFYENPTDIHTVSANASNSEPAKFLAFLIKDKGKPATRPVAPDPAQ